jgi:hypothetical protein
MSPQSITVYNYAIFKNYHFLLLFLKKLSLFVKTFAIINPLYTFVV